MIQVYTGNGKGKTTAAWGLALRAVGRGLEVAVVRFLKPAVSGEQIAGERLAPQLSVFGHTRPYDVCACQRDCPPVRDDSRENFRLAAELILSRRYALVVLDEINMVLHYGFVTREEMLDLLARAPEGTELVATGRYAPDWLLDAADLVTEMIEVKHPACDGAPARKGIEF